MIVVVYVALLATICSGQNAQDFFKNRPFNPELWPKLPKGAVKEWISEGESEGDHTGYRVRYFPCLDQNADLWPFLVKLCVAEVWRNGEIDFPSGLKGAGNIDPKYGLCVLYEQVKQCLLERGVRVLCGDEAVITAEVFLLSSFTQPAKVRESCNRHPNVGLIRIYTGFGDSSYFPAPVRRRFITKTPRHIQQCLDSNEEYFKNELSSCNDYENRTQRMNEDYESCLSYGLQSHCLASAVEERCGMEGVGSAMERVRSEMPFDVWASCTVHPAFVFTETPPGVKFLDQPLDIFTLAAKTQEAV